MIYNNNNNLSQWYRIKSERMCDILLRNDAYTFHFVCYTKYRLRFIMSMAKQNWNRKERETCNIDIKVIWSEHSNKGTIEAKSIVSCCCCSILPSVGFCACVRALYVYLFDTVIQLNFNPWCIAQNGLHLIRYIDIGSHYIVYGYATLIIWHDDVMVKCGIGIHAKSPKALRHVVW